MKNTLLYIGIILGAFACTRERFVPEEGDLYFQVSGKSDFTNAIATVTGDSSQINFTHVGIAVRDKGNWAVLEATPEEGVKLTPLQKFLDASAFADGSPIVAVYRLRDRHRVRIADAVGHARECIGRPYDEAFLPHNEALYCSELVYESYLDTLGRPVFTARPMNFRARGESQPAVYWLEYFSRLGLPVPEGVPGTNPADLAREKSLRPLFRYF